MATPIRTLNDLFAPHDGAYLHRLRGAANAVLAGLSAQIQAAPFEALYVVALVFGRMGHVLGLPRDDAKRLLDMAYAASVASEAGGTPGAN